MGSSDARAASDGLLACRGLGGVVLQKQAGGSCLNAASGNLAHESRAGGNSLHGGRDGLWLPGANAAYWDEKRLLLLCFHVLLEVHVSLARPLSPLSFVSSMGMH